MFDADVSYAYQYNRTELVATMRAGGFERKTNEKRGVSVTWELGSVSF
jgi:hypothetical protein